MGDVPEQKCVSVPRQGCVTVPDQVCTSEPLTECQDVPRQQCHSEHKRFPIRVSRQEPKKVCDEAPVHAPLAVPVHHQQPSVQDLLSYGVPAVPAQAAPEIILARDSKSSRMPPTTIGLFSHKSRSNSRNFSCNGDTKCI